MREETEKGKKGGTDRKWGERERKRKEGELAEGREKRRERQKGGGRGGRNLNIHWLKGYPVSIFSPKR